MPLRLLISTQLGMTSWLTWGLCDGQVKMHWVHDTYWLPGPQGNDIHKTNVPNLRMRFRYDNHQEEVYTLF